MNDLSELTVPAMLILAANEIEASGVSPFSAEALVVAAWQKFPDRFGLAGYVERYPDSNKVLASLMGEKGMVRRGWLVRTASKRYALTAAGRRVYREITGAPEPVEADGSPRRLPAPLERFIVDRFGSRAVRKFEEGQRAEVCFGDACQFWRITESMTRDQIDAALAAVQTQLARLDEFCADADAQLGSGQVLTGGDVRVLTNIHRNLEERFERHVNLLRTRVIQGRKVS